MEKEKSKIQMAFEIGISLALIFGIPLLVFVLILKIL